jgi:hypothetical protein
MDLKEIKAEKRKLEIKLFNDIKEFEDKTELEIKSISILRGTTGLQLIQARIEIEDE